jgi:hypothetical protein
MFRKELENKIEALSQLLNERDSETLSRKAERDRHSDMHVCQSIRILKVREHDGLVTIDGIDIEDGESTVYEMDVIDWELALEAGQIERVICGSKKGDILRVLEDASGNYGNYFVAR